MRACNTNSRRQRVRNANTLNAKTDDDDDDDYYFFTSLLPYPRDVPRNIRIRIRNKVHRVFVEQLEKYNNAKNEEPSNNHTPSPSPPNSQPIIPEEELPQVPDPIQHPLPVYLFAHSHHVYHYAFYT